MAMCKNCGARIADNAATCPCCGAPAGTTAEDFINKVKNLNNTSDHTHTFYPPDVQANKLMAVLSYLSWLVLIPIFAAKDSPYARFHVNQGLILAITEIIWGVLSPQLWYMTRKSSACTASTICLT